MRKIWSIFLVSFADTLQNRGEQFVWLLLSIFNTMSILLLWFAAFHSGGIKDIAIPFISLYYATLLIISQGIMSHAEEGIVQDIRTGSLSMHLMKPYPYFWFTWFSELSWRIMGSLYTFIIFIGFVILSGGIHTIYLDKLCMATVILLLAFFLSYTYKFTLSMSGFFITECRPVFELMEITVIIGGGFLMPLEFAPNFIRTIAFHLPFVSFVYYPVKALLGQISLSEFPSIVATQIFWIGFFSITLWMLWKLGLREYTALGQ